MNPPASSQCVKQIKAAARSVVAGTAGLLAGAQQLHGSILMLPEGQRFQHPAVDAFLKAVPSKLLTGESKLYVSDQELIAADAKLTRIEEAHRTQVLLECKHIYFACAALQHARAEAASSEGSNPQ